jgi:nucleotide-binding universal stress UspA family protein
LKRFLLATDLSSRADRALERSIQLARSHEGHLTILHVVDEDLPAGVRNQHLAAAEAEIGTVLKNADGARDVEVSILVTTGRDHLTILETAERDACDLIVVGRHRDEAAEGPLRGTTMERMMRQGTTPVLVVADRADAPYRNIMVGVDFSVFSRFAVKAAFAVAADADFHFVHAYQVPFEGFLPGRGVQREVSREREQTLSRMVDEEMDILLQAGAGGASDDMKERVHRILRDGEVLSVLRSEAARLKPDLLVIGTHGRVGIAHAMLGSVAENLLNHPPCDVLAVKAW